jgi:hypothetical protein
MEGMHVRMEKASVVGLTDSSGETWVINASMGVDRVFNDDPEGIGEVVCVSDEGLYQIAPQTKATDQILNLQGALDGTDWNFLLHPILQPELHPGDLPMEVGAPQVDHGFTLGTFNLANLFDSLDDPLTDDTVLTAAEYQRRLQKRALAIHEILAEPDILVVQGAENLLVLQALVNRPEIVADYGIVWVDSPDKRGLDIAVLYHHDRAALLGYHVEQGCTGIVDGLGPDGNGDVKNPANSLTCDRNGDGIPDGNRLFSRPPLAVSLRIVVMSSQETDQPQTIDVTLLANHWKSKLEDTKENQYTLARRLEQAQFTASLMQELKEKRKDEYLVLAGDLNDVPGSEPLSILKTTGLRDLTLQIDRSSRYTLIFQGVSQVIDYLMELPLRGLGPAQIKAMHINADFPTVFTTIDDTVYRSSDHDPLWVNIIPLTEYVHFPQVYIGE